MKLKYPHIDRRTLSKIDNAKKVVELANGSRSITGIAETAGLTKSYVSWLLKWASILPGRKRLGRGK